MVKNFRATKAQFATLIKNTHYELAETIESICDDLRAEMDRDLPLRDGTLWVDWTWGDAPKGSITIARYSRGGQTTEYNQIKATIYAQGEWPPGWWEFGTRERFQSKTGRRTGRIQAQPFFFPNYRAKKRSIKLRLAAAVRRAVKKTQAGS